MGWSRIRLYSRLAALALAALVFAGVGLLRVRRVHEHFNSLTITSYIVSEPAPQYQTPPRKPPPIIVPNHAFATRLLGPRSSDTPPRLWSYDALGQIVFDRAEQYRRCLNARAAHHNEADCPEPHDPHPLALRPDSLGF
ncbi:MAG: hypothetical protein HY054_03175 [Proteobacteria bacterium]|nr:hypothetical protein [Pseudomonadota bacterium]